MAKVSCTIDHSNDSNSEGRINLSHAWYGALSISVVDEETRRTRVQVHLDSDEYKQFSNELLQGRNVRTSTYGFMKCGICAGKWLLEDDPDEEERPIITADGWIICWSCHRKIEDAADAWRAKPAK